jgi:hypothetical protein
MYDGINTDASAITAAAKIVAGYVDGLYKWSAADWARFPRALKVRIAVFASTDDGVALDCEPGNCTPAQSVDWVLMRRKTGIDPTVYCGRNTWWPAIRAAFKARRVPEPHYWVADYAVDPSGPQIPAGAIALQYKDAGSDDLSVVADYWPGVDPAPARPVPTRAIRPEDDMQILIDVSPDPTQPGTKGTHGFFVVSDVHVDHVVTTADLQDLEAKFGAPAVTTPGQYAEYVANRAPVTVQLDAAAVAAALAKLVPTADAIAAAIPAHLGVTVTAKP